MPTDQPTSPTTDPALQDFRLDARAEVGALLSELRRLAVPVTLSSPDGRHWTVTVLALDAQRGTLTLETNMSPERVEELLACPSVEAQAFLDSIRLQFDVNGLMRIGRGQHASLSANFPPAIYRFQRRQAYRVPTPGLQYPAAVLERPRPGDLPVRLRVLDISTGGVALALPADQPAPEAGRIFEQARLELDRGTRIDAALRIQHVSPLQNTEGSRQIGCALLHLPREAQRDLQLFIDQAQKKLRLLRRQ